MLRICAECDGSGIIKDINGRSMKCYECNGMGEFSA